MPDYKNFQRKDRVSGVVEGYQSPEGQGFVGSHDVENFETTNVQQTADFTDKIDASMRQNVIGMRSIQQHDDEEDGRGIASTVAHDMFGDMFGLISNTDPMLDKKSKEVQDLLKTVPNHLQQLVYDENNFPDMVHRAKMIHSEMADQDAMHSSSFMARLGYGALAMPLDPTTWLTFGAGAALKATKMAAMMNSTALRRVGVTAATGGLAGGGSEYLIRKASDQEYSGVAMSALFSAGLAGSIHGTMEFIQHNGGRRQAEIREQVQNGELDLAVNPEKVYSAMSELEKSQMSVGFNRVAGWVASLTTNKITKGLAASPQMQLLMDGYRNKADSIKASLEMWQHDTGPIGMKDKDGKDVVMDKKNVQDLRYQMAFENVKFDKVRIETYNKYTKARENMTPQERVDNPQLTHEQFSVEMNEKTSKIYDDYSNAKTKEAYAMRQDPMEVQAAKDYAQTQIDNAIVKYDLEQKAKDKSYVPPKQEDVTEIEWSQHMEDAFGGRDQMKRILDGHEAAYFKNEATARTPDPLMDDAYREKFEDYELEFFTQSNSYYKNRADRMKANGLDEFATMDPLHYNPRMWHVDKVKGDITQATLDIETAIRDSVDYKLALDQARRELDEATAYKNDPAKQGEYMALVDHLVAVEKQLDDLMATMASIDKQGIIDSQLANHPFALVVDPNITSFTKDGVTYNVGETLNMHVPVKDSRISIRQGHVVGVNAKGEPLVMMGNGELRIMTDRYGWTVNGKSGAAQIRQFNRELAATQSRHNHNTIADMVPTSEQALYPKDTFNDPVLDALWNAAGRPEIRNSPIIETNEAGGVSVPYTNKVYVKSAYGKQSAKATLYHEMVHTLTVKQYYADPVFKKEIDDIYSEVMIQAEKDGMAQKNSKNEWEPLNTDKSHSYGLTNPKEMLAEFYSNPEFVAYMKTISTQYNVKAVATSDSMFARLLFAMKSQVIKATKAFEGAYGRKSSVKNTAGALLTVMNNHETMVHQNATYTKRKLTDVEEKLTQIANYERMSDIVKSKGFNGQARMTHDEWVQILSAGGMKKGQIKVVISLLEKIGKSNKKNSKAELNKIYDDVRAHLEPVMKVRKKIIDKYDKKLLEDELVSLHDNAGQQVPGQKETLDSLHSQKDMLKRDSEEMRMKLDDADPRLKASRGRYEELVKSPKEAAKNAVTNMVSEGHMLQNAKMTTDIPGIFNERSLHIDSSHPSISKYLHKNEARIQQMYDYKTVGKISTQDIFGTVDRAKYEQHLKENVTTNKEQIGLLGDMFDRGLGTKQMPADPTNGFEVFARTASNFNYITMGGQFAKYGFAEMGATIHSTGYRAFMEAVPALKLIVQMYKNGELSKADMNMLMLSESGEIYKGNNMAALGDGTDISSTFAGEGPGFLNKAEGMTKRMQQWMFRYSGLEASTVWTKLVLPRAFMNRIIGQVADGKLDGGAVKDLKRWGLSSRDMIDISRENWTRDINTGKIDDFNLEGWHNKDLAIRFERAVHKMSRDTIMRPDANRLPNWLTDGSSNIMVKMARQFMSFMFLSHERLLIRGINERQAQAAMSALVSFGFLAMFETVGEIAAIQAGIIDEDDAYYTSDDPDKFMQAMMRVGTLNSYAGLGPTGYEMYELFFGNGYGDRSRSLGKMAGGPTLKRASDAKRAAKDIWEGTYGTRSQWDLARTATPFNNLFGMDYLSKNYIFNSETWK